MATPLKVTVRFFLVIVYMAKLVW